MSFPTRSAGLTPQSDVKATRANTTSAALEAVVHDRPAVSQPPKTPPARPLDAKPKTVRRSSIPLGGDRRGVSPVPQHSTYKSFPPFESCYRSRRISALSLMPICSGSKGEQCDKVKRKAGYLPGEDGEEGGEEGTKQGSGPFKKVKDLLWGAGSRKDGTKK
jgi:hypothetical protein